MIHRRFVKTMAVAAALAVPLGASAEPLVDKLLRIAGLTAAPAQMRGPGEQVDAGRIWIANLERRTVSPATPDGGYRSPVFSPTDGSIVALKGDAVVRIPPAGGQPTLLQRLTAAAKLVGFDGANPDEIVVLLESGSSPLAVLSLKTGTVAALPYDARSSDQRRMLAQIRGQERTYGTTSVYVKTESKQGLSRVVEWTDVYVRRSASPPQNVSGCDGENCAQPALSPDGRRVAFVKAGG
jgi:Tol biopolymer transport system component